MFSEEIKYQLDFAKKSKIFYITIVANEDDYKNNIIDLKKFLKSTKSDKISLVNYHECFSRTDRLNEVRDIINQNNDKTIFISAATSTSIDNLYNPLVNIFFWKSARTRYDISWKSDEIDFYLFDKKWYESDFKKQIKGILSVRKETDFRNKLFSFIDASKFDGVFRYAKWTGSRNDETFEYLNQKNKFPTFIELIKEYQKSYCSFVIESELSEFMNPFTEKTMISFLTKTMPVVLGGQNYVKELKEMGFYVFNDEFGFGDSDTLPTFDSNKAIGYNKCIEKYNSFTFEEITDMYKSNIDKIENNYNIISQILFDTKNSII